MERLEGRIAVITGAGSGIGRATALALADQGVDIVLVGRGLSRLETVAQEIERAGAAALIVQHDVAEAAAFEIVRDQAIARFGRVDIVMNNAAAISTALPEDMPVEEWRRVIEINLMAPVRSNAAFLPLLLAQGEGHLVNTASVDGLYGFAFDRLPYAASKAALVTMSEGLALYLRPRGIGITCLCPGPVVSDIGALMKSFGRPHDILGAGESLAPLPAEHVGAMVVDAIRRDIFLLLTHPEQVGGFMVDRARDPDGFVDHQIAHPHILFSAADPLP